MDPYIQNILGQLRPCSPMSDILSSAEEVFGKGVTVVFGTMFKQEAMNLSSLAMGGECISLLLPGVKPITEVYVYQTELLNPMFGTSTSLSSRNQDLIYHEVLAPHKIHGMLSVGAAALSCRKKSQELK